MRRTVTRHAVGVALLCHGLAVPAFAAEGFKLRFPLSGTLGGEMVAPLDRPGWFGSVAVTQMDIDKVTDDSGQARRQSVSGASATPVPVAGQVRTATYDGTIDFDARQTQTQTNLLIGYLTDPAWGGGRLSFALNLPYTSRLDRQVALTGQTPTLSPLSPALTSPPLPAGTAEMAQAAAQAGFDTAWQGNLAAQSAASSGVVEGIGDVELTAAWVLQQERMKLVAGVTLALPTGAYDPAPTAINVGFGNYYTLRPGVAVAWTPLPAWTFGARASIGFNSRNRDNDVRTGNFAALDAAAAWRTPIGIVGPHLTHVQQFQDDSGGAYGANRFSATGGGAFFTTLIRPLGAALNISWMQMLRSRNALDGTFFQFRVTKAF